MNIRQLDLQELKACPILPEDDEIHLFFFHSDDMDNMHKTLSRKSHALLRQILSLYTGIPADSLAFTQNKHGKPQLDHTVFSKAGLSLSSNAPRIHFNLSHSGNCIAFAFSCTSPVGIDIEKTDRKAKTAAIAKRMFLPEEVSYLNRLPEEESHIEFFRLWTRTESFLKGIGTGFHQSFKDENIQQAYTCWTVKTYMGTDTVTVPDGYICSVAYRH